MGGKGCGSGSGRGEGGGGVVRVAVGVVAIVGGGWRLLLGLGVLWASFVFIWAFRPIRGFRRCPI